MQTLTGAARLYDIQLVAVATTPAKGDRVEIRGFGSFGLNYRRPRVWRKPKSGERVEVVAKHVPRFKAGREMRPRVDEVLVQVPLAKRKLA